MKQIVKKLERRRGRRGPQPFAHCTDDELRAALERVRKGRPGGLRPYPGDPSTWPATGLAHLTDKEIEQRLDAATKRLRTPHHREQEEKR